MLFVSSPEQPGADTTIHALLMRNLDRSRFEVHVACPAGPPLARTAAYRSFSTIPDIRIRPTDFGPPLKTRSRRDRVTNTLRFLGAAVSLIGLAWYVWRHRIEVLHSTDRARDALSCVVLARLTGARSVLHVHVAYGRWMSWATRWSLARADALVAISDFVARSLERNGLSLKRIRVVLNAIDAAAFDPPADRAEARSRLRLAGEDLVVVCIARLFRWKGQAELIRALPAVLREVPQTRLLIVGEDDLSANPGGASFADELRRLAIELGVARRVTLTGHRTDIGHVLAASDVFAMPSFEEPFGLVYLEAMAMRIPVLALSSGGAPEIVDDGRSGFLSPVGDGNALAERLLALLRDPDLRHRMGEYGRMQIETRFTPRRLADETALVYAALAYA